MFTLKHNKGDDGISFSDVHSLIKYFKNQIYKDLQRVTEANDWDSVATFSKLFNSDKKHTFKNISSGPLSFKEVFRELYSKLPNHWSYRSLASIPSNHRILIEWVDNGEGAFEPKKITWGEFWKKYAGKDPILTSDELRYKME